MTAANPLELGALPLAARAGLSALLAVVGLGLLASLEHLRAHHQGRDGEPGVSRLDLVGAYRGVSIPAPLRTALERGHPESLAAGERAALLAWLARPDRSQRYDDPDLGDQAPAEIVGRACLDCHARASAEAGAGIALEYWDDVERLAADRELAATPVSILWASTHAHALGLASLTIALDVLLLLTRFAARRPALVGGLVGLTGVALALDFAAQWGLRASEACYGVLVVSGAAFAAGTALSVLVVFVDLWWPRGGGERP